MKVREWTRKMARDLYEVRETMEGLAARLGAERATPEIVTEMEQCLDRQKDIVDEADAVAYSRSDHNFHLLIYRACGNDLLRELLEGLRYKALPLAFRLAPHFGEFLNFHREILEAFRQRDGRRAGLAIRSHNRRMLNLIETTAWGGEGE